MEATFTTRPYPAATIPGATALRTLKAPFRLTASTASHSSSLILRRLRSRVMPALFTRSSGGRGSAATAAVTSAARRTSPVGNRMPPPGGPASRSRTWTSAPSPARRSAMPRPMPRAPPVTSATRSWNRPAVGLAWPMIRSLPQGLEKAQPLRAREPGAGQEPLQGEVVPLHLGEDPLDPQRAQVAQELLQQGPPGSPARERGVHADGVEDRHRIGAAELPQVHPGHEEPDELAVHLGHQGHPPPGLPERLARFALVVRGPVAPGDLAIDADDGRQVAFGHGAHR